MTSTSAAPFRASRLTATLASWRLSIRSMLAVPTVSRLTVIQSMKCGRRGLRRPTFALPQSTSRPRQACSSAKGVTAAHARGALGSGDAGEKQLAGVRGAHGARPLFAVERKRISADLIVPEGLLEGAPQGLGLEREPGGKAQLLHVGGEPRRHAVGEV